MQNCEGNFFMEPIVHTLVVLSQLLLSGVRRGDNVDELLYELKTTSPERMAIQLSTDSLKTAFWLNIYNAQIQLALKSDTSAYNNRTKFFKAKRFWVAGQQLSFDDVEHGILRHSKIKWSLGYLTKWFVNPYERKNRVDKLDWRIHFALNCGAASCPPIQFYNPDKLDEQLNLATANYLSADVIYNIDNKTVIVPKLMFWFKKDFGGKKGIYSILEQQKLLPIGSKPTIKYKPYSWKLALQYYIE